MKPIATFKVRPSLPEALQPLLRIAYNLRWSWDAGAVQLFLTEIGTEKNTTIVFPLPIEFMSTFQKLLEKKD